MRKYLFIGAGGIIGAILRYLIKEVEYGRLIGPIPLDTLFINVFGCFLFALILTVTLETLEFSSNLRLGIATGLLGAFTTFSTLCKETVVLINQGLYFYSLFYIAISIVLSFFSVYLGIALARKFAAGRLKDKKSKPSQKISGGGGEL